MKLTIPTSLLKSSLGRISSIPGANNASMHTQCVSVEAGMAGLTLKRFTSEARISITLEEGIYIDEGGEVFVSHSALSNLVNACNGKEILVFTDKNLMHLESGRGKWKLKFVSEDLLSDPPSPELETDETEILLEDLTELLSFAAPAASKDTAGSYAFCGVNIHQREDRLYFVATDGKRCHIATAGYDLPVNGTIGTESVDAILKLIDGQSGGATFAMGETSASVTTDSMEISISLLADPYPKVLDGFLAQSESSIESKVATNRDEFADALEACAKINESDSRIVSLKIDKKVLQVNGSNARDSEGGISVDCTATKSALVGVPGITLAQALRKFKAAEDGTIEFAQTGRALFIKQPERMAFFALAKPPTA